MEDHRMAIEELVRGREFANQLRQIISGDDESRILGTPFAQHLVKNVLRSFTNTIFLLDKSHEVSHDQMQKRDSSLISSPAKSEDSQESCRSSTDKCRRGCYKRRKDTQTYWEKVSEIPEDDGHLWRKYGQKEILNAKYSRSYYRCTHKFDQRCQATKQVQRIQEKPPLYKTIYYGHHTCKNILNPDIILDPNSPSDTSILLSFNNTFPTPSKQDCPFVSSPPSQSENKECKEDVSSSSLLDDDYLLSHEPTTFDNLYSRHVTTLSSTLESDNRDLFSSFLCDSVVFDDVFQPFVQF
ncbi:WRKY domain [Sesbania bispinosa]|nr:WRKY domain [Sesbania bispinosa]